MALNPIGDIANPNLTKAVAGNLVWETASDWDNAVSEVGIIHDTIGDRSDAAVLRKGYPDFDRGGSALEAYWHADDASSPITDAVGGVDLSASGNPTFDSTGIFESTEVDFDGAGDYATGSISTNSGLDPQGGDFTLVMWVNVDQFGDGEYGQIFGTQDNSNEDSWKLYKGNAGEFRWRIHDGSNSVFPSSAFNPSNGTWYMVGGRFDASTGEAGVWVDGSERGTETIAGTVDYPNGANIVMGADANNPSNQQYNGRAGEAMYFSRRLSDAEMVALYDVFNGESTITTQTKSFGSATKVNLDNLVYDQSDAAESIDLDVIGSPGEAGEETVTQSLTGASSYTLTWSNSHTDYQIKPRLSTTDVTKTPTLSAVELTPQ